MTYFIYFGITIQVFPASFYSILGSCVFKTMCIYQFMCSNFTFLYMLLNDKTAYKAAFFSLCIQSTRYKNSKAFPCKTPLVFKRLTNNSCWVISNKIPIMYNNYKSIMINKKNINTQLNSLKDEEFYEWFRGLVMLKVVLTYLP